MKFAARQFVHLLHWLEGMAAASIARLFVHLKRAQGDLTAATTTQSSPSCLLLIVLCDQQRERFVCSFPNPSINLQYRRVTALLIASRISEGNEPVKYFSRELRDKESCARSDRCASRCPFYLCICAYVCVSISVAWPVRRFASDHTTAVVAHCSQFVGSIAAN